MGTLNFIQQTLLKEHPALESNIISSSEALHVWRNKSDRKGLKYLPNFHLIFQVHQNENLTLMGENLRLKKFQRDKQFFGLEKGENSKWEINKAWP